MKRALLILVLVFETLEGFAQNPLELLEKAYRNKSHNQLDAFFQDWRQKMPANEPQDHDTIQCIYKVFDCFYNPMELEVVEMHFPYLTIAKQRKDGSYVEHHFFEKRYKRYAKTRYFMVQDGLTIFVVDTVNGKDRQDVTVPYNFYWGQTWFDTSYKIIREISLTEFRPKTQFFDKVVYLTSDYRETLNKFLEANTDPFSTKKVSTSTSLRIKSKKKFIKGYISPIFYEHRNYWLLNTWPVVNYMIADAQLNYVVVCFSKYTEGGYAVYHRMGGEWKLIKTDQTTSIDY